MKCNKRDTTQWFRKMCSRCDWVAFLVIIIKDKVLSCFATNKKNKKRRKSHNSRKGNKQGKCAFCEFIVSVWDRSSNESNQQDAYKELFNCARVHHPDQHGADRHGPEQCASEQWLDDKDHLLADESADTELEGEEIEKIMENKSFRFDFCLCCHLRFE